MANIGAEPKNQFNRKWTYHTDSKTIKDLKSVESSIPTRFSIENKSENFVLVYWINYVGCVEPYMKLHAGETREWPTFAGHSWMVTDERLATVLVYTAGTNELEQVEVTAALFQSEPGQVCEERYGPWLSGFEWLPEHWSFDDKIAVEAKSLSGLCSTHFKIENLKAHPVSLFWLNYQGEATFHSSLDPGELHEQLTYATHPWLIKDDCGKDLLFFTAGTRQMEYVKIA